MRGDSQRISANRRQPSQIRQRLFAVYPRGRHASFTEVQAHQRLTKQAGNTLQIIRQGIAAFVAITLYNPARIFRTPLSN
jgi:hypothetical protein